MNNQKNQNSNNKDVDFDLSTNKKIETIKIVSFPITNKNRISSKNNSFLQSIKLKIMSIMPLDVKTIKSSSLVKISDNFAPARFSKISFAYQKEQFKTKISAFFKSIKLKLILLSKQSGVKDIKIIKNAVKVTEKIVNPFLSLTISTKRNNIKLKNAFSNLLKPRPEDLPNYDNVQFIVDNEDGVATSKQDATQFTIDDEIIATNNPKLAKSIKWRKICNSIMGVIVFFILLGSLSGISVIKVILSKTDVELDTSDLKTQDSSLIYDDAGNQIAIIGEESRISYPYSKMPQVVIDAFIAIEDSRFFEHKGFDLPRFAKAFLENIKTLSFSQGGSTITMQVIKNTYFAVDTLAEKSIDRKVQEIYYSLKINDIVSKEKILELYINKANFGANARGIQIASLYYFNKNCTDLTLVEAALLAGLVHSPNNTNPYLKLEACKTRTNEVLYQMLNHGYISKYEYELAKKVKIENLLSGVVEHSLGNGNTISNQAYIDVVLAELESEYNINPYITPVKVYTGMNQIVQSYCDEVSRGNIVKYADNHVNNALVVIQNKTGVLVGLCGGRDYDGQKIFNYAYDNKINPGSTAKGIFTYPMGFEYGGLGTNLYIADEPMVWTGTRITINEEHGYLGDISVQRAFTSSLNIVAVKVFRMAAEKAGYDTLKNYLRDIGIDKETYSKLNEQYAIGAQHFLLSPIQLAAAESVILSNGVYTKPHTITRIEFIGSNKEPIVANFESRQVLSKGAAYLTSYLQRIAVNGGATVSDMAQNGRLSYIKKRNYTVYGKTGTSLYDKNIMKKYHIPSSGAKDFLMIGGTTDYSFSYWLGYDTGQYIDSTTYVSSRVRGSHIDGKTVNGLLNAITDAFGLPKNKITRPSTVVSITHLINSYPYTTLPEGADSSLLVTSLVLKGTYEFTDYIHKSDIASITSFSANYNADSKKIVVSWSPYPDEDATVPFNGINTTVFNKKTYKLGTVCSWKLIDGEIQYRLVLTNNSTGEVKTFNSNSPILELPIENLTENPVTYSLTGYYSYAKIDVRSNSMTTNVTVPVTPVVPEIPEVPETP